MTNQAARFSSLVECSLAAKSAPRSCKLPQQTKSLHCTKLTCCRSASEADTEVYECLNIFRLRCVRDNTVAAYEMTALVRMQALILRLPSACGSSV